MNGNGPSKPAIGVLLEPAPSSAKVRKSNGEIRGAVPPIPSAYPVRAVAPVPPTTHEGQPTTLSSATRQTPAIWLREDAGSDKVGALREFSSSNIAPPSGQATPKLLVLVEVVKFAYPARLSHQTYARTYAELFVRFPASCSVFTTQQITYHKSRSSMMLSLTPGVLQRFQSASNFVRALPPVGQNR